MCVTNPNFTLIYIKPLLRYGNLMVFKLAAVRHLGFVVRLFGPSAKSIWWVVFMSNDL